MTKLMSAKDARDVKTLAVILAREAKRSCFPHVDQLLARGSDGLSYRRVCNLLRLFETELCEAAGLKGVRYSAAYYAASGRGAFGRLGGGRAGKYHRPRVALEQKGA